MKAFKSTNFSRKKAPVGKDKPPYKVPSMSEIEALPWNGFKVASTFSGCGGSCLGYRMAGFKVVWASEFVPSAQDSYRLNHSSHLDTRDVREVRPEDVLEIAGLNVGELDVFDGSPPCTAFSMAGKREKLWGKEKKYDGGQVQTDEDLFPEYVRLVRGLQPKVFIAENVRGMTVGKAKGVLIETLEELERAGYVVEAKLLDAQWLGVPQRRSRLIIQGVRKDLGLSPRFPLPLPYRYSIRDALPHLLEVVHDTGTPGFSSGEVTDQLSPTITIGVNSVNSYHFKAKGPRIIHDTGGDFSIGELDPDDVLPTVETQRVNFRIEGLVHVAGSTVGEVRSLDEPAPTVMMNGIDNNKHSSVLLADGPSIERFAIGKEASKLKPGEGSSKYLNLVRPHPDEPCPTVTVVGGVASVIHPEGTRKFSIDELKPLCGFPDDFKLAGTYTQQWARMGNAVPPLMMRAIATSVRGILEQAKADGKI